MCALRLLRSILMLLLVAGTSVAGAQSQPQLVPLYFTGLPGGDTALGRRVLLRWDAVDGVVDLENAVLFRVSQGGQRQKIAVVRRTRNPQLIQAIFYRPGEDRVRTDAREALARVFGTAGNTPAQFAALAIELLEGRDASEYADLRRNFLVQSNYGFAMIEGRAYLDFVNPAEGPFVYELWRGNAQGDAVDALGRITIDANNVTVLPAPANLREVMLRGRDGVTPARANHRRIYLNFDVGEDLRAYSSTMFGYNIYKLPRALAAGETFDSVREELVRLNALPILEPSPIEGESPDQSYIFVDDGDWLATGDEDSLPAVGTTATYWAVARDLLGTEGLPSNPLVATVRDTFEPNAPRGVQVFEDKGVDRTPFLHVLWNVQTEDTVAFNVYRYQQYGNAGKKGPFPPINGFTEGFIFQVVPPAPAPDQAKFSYRDAEVNQAARGTGFWYCVSAVDAHGNESALSPPVYGVIDDVVGPTPGRVVEFCVPRPILTASGSNEVVPLSRTQEWDPRFVLRRTHPAITRVRVSTVTIIPQGGPTSGGQVVLFEGDFGEREALEFTTTDFGIESQDQVPAYTVTFTAVNGDTVETVLDPPAFWTVGSERVVYRAVAGVSRFDRTCNPFGPGGAQEPGPVPVIPGVDVPPFQITLGCDGETVQWRLYRSVDGGRTYALVRETPCSGAGLDLTDDFHPDTLTEVRYSVVPVDKHGNLGAPQYLEPVFVYATLIPTPTMVALDPVGPPGNPSLRVRWMGPRDGVQFYRILFLDEANTPRRWLEVPTAELSFDPALNLFERVVSTIDRDGNPLDPNVSYKVSVEAVTLASTAKASTSLPVNWNSKLLNQGPAGTFRWNARPVPPTSPLDLNAIEFFTVHKGVMIQIRRFGGNEQGIPKQQVPPFPFMVWRQRTDRPGQPWMAVSPLINEEHYTGTLLDDGFFRLEHYPEPSSSQKLFFLDNSGHVFGAEYRYLFLHFDPKSGEILRVYGPLSIQILIPG